MSQGRKYANLPDLDSAPDVYETGNAGPDSTTVVATQSSAAETSSNDDARASSSPSSGDEGTDGHEGKPKASRIDRHPNHPSQARQQFSRYRVDAKGVDFSDRISSRTKSYRVFSRGRRRRVRSERGGYVEEYGNFGEEDEDESFDERLARLRREVEEVKVEGARRLNEDNGQLDTTEIDSLGELDDVLRSIQTRGRSLGSSTRAVQPERPSERPTPGSQSLPDQAPTTPPEDVSRILARASDFDSRIADLEQSLGNFQSQTSASANKDIITTLSMLESQLAFLSNTSTSSLESLDNQIRHLIEDATKLTEARKAARTAQESLIKGTPASGVHSRSSSAAFAQSLSKTNADSAASPFGAKYSPPDAEQAAKIDTLFNNISIVESMAPTLPAVVERLKSLRLLHAEAAMASENLSEVEKKQAMVSEELGKWREGVERLEQSLQRGAGAQEKNEEAVEKWIRDLETRMAKLES